MSKGAVVIGGAGVRLVCLDSQARDDLQWMLEQLVRD